MKKSLTLFFIFIGIVFGIIVHASPINVDYSNGIYHIVLKGKSIQKELHFVSSSNLITNKEAHNKAHSKLTVNAGFFDPNNQKSISYIVDDYNTVEDPLFNEGLTLNPVLRQNLTAILNRTEFRVLDCDSKIKYEIAPHNAKTDFLCSVKTSAQGGPQLLPQLRLEEEFFVVKDKENNITRESASVLHKCARTLIGLKTNNGGEQEIHLFIVTDQHPLTIYESRDLCKSYGLDSAMAFDGGSSTSMNYKNISVISTENNGDTGRALKSFLILQKNKHF